MMFLVSHSVHAVFAESYSGIVFRCHLFQFVTDYTEPLSADMDLESSVPSSPLCPCEKSFLRWAAIRCKSGSVSHVNVLMVLSYLCLNWVWAPVVTQTETKKAQWRHVQKATISHSMECKVCH